MLNVSNMLRKRRPLLTVKNSLELLLLYQIVKFHKIHNFVSIRKSDQWNIAVSSTYSSLPNRRGARNKRGGGKDEPFLISVLSGISIVERIFRPASVIKRKTK